ncbi:Isochorismatase hydrolase [Auriscalpium vulgare]|uniref:Isochorismatase hydrolase n=1 Tax=Auriscalpium vulgare TaxID=40419 RepID=A0ACB8S8P5_9AGAM|nr:Isochorismatase hydrolase [Auriscalpium vulgare]
MSTPAPVHDHPISGMTERPRVEEITEYGNAASFWVEYPSGLLDLTRSVHAEPPHKQASEPPLQGGQIDIPVDGGRTIRVDATKTALIVIDMQNFFLHPDIRVHPTGLACVDPTLNVLPALRSQGAKILWVNWGLTDHELKTIPPALVRGFRKRGGGGFGSEMSGNWGRLLMRGAANADLYGPLQTEYLKGSEAGTDVWIHKNRMSGLWGYQTALDLYLKEKGITTLLFGGVNADQCVLGTVVDAYFRGYDVVLIKDATATSSPEGALENVVYNAGGSYGFVTDTARIVKAVESMK